MRCIGFDIGGANVKAADSDGSASTSPFEIWRHPERLADVLRDMLQAFPQPDVLAVTMTAELADCFPAKAEGVDRILAAVETAAEGKPVYVWQTGAEFVTPEVAREIPLLVAAANWHALATWAGRMVPKSAAVLIDVGTTTTDIIPLLGGVPVPAGLTDRERLQSGELVYTGVRRTPVCAIARSIPFREGYCPLAAELFATMLDVYLLLDEIAANPADCATANGKPATTSNAHDRLARMVCCDRSEFTVQDARLMSRFLAGVQKQRINGALEQVLAAMDSIPQHVIIAGSGAFLAAQLVGEHRRLQNCEVISLADVLAPEISNAACAHAVARLASERLTGWGKY